MSGKIHRLKSSYADVISTVNDFFTNRIQALQHRWKKCMVDCKGDYVEKETTFCDIPWEYLDQLKNFLANPYIYIYNLSVDDNIYIVIERQTVLLYHNTSVWLDT